MNDRLVATTSVAMATFNGAAHLEPQLTSILAQSCLPSELVISDDGSDDGTHALLERFAAVAPFPVRVLHGPERLGVTRNFERAIADCQGELIILADQDDIWLPSKMAIITDAFQRLPDVAYVFSNAYLIDENGLDLAGTLWQKTGLSPRRLLAYQEGDQMLPLLRERSFIYGMTMAFRARFRSCLLPIASNSLSCTHDTWASLLLSGLGERGRGHAIDEPLVRYRQHSRQEAGAPKEVSGFLDAVLLSLRSKQRFDPKLSDDLMKIADRIDLYLDQLGHSTISAHLLRQKAMHLNARRVACESPLGDRFRLIARELKTGRYALFSSPVRSVIRDLIS